MSIIKFAWLVYKYVNNSSIKLHAALLETFFLIYYFQWLRGEKYE